LNRGGRFHHPPILIFEKATIALDKTDMYFGARRSASTDLSR